MNTPPADETPAMTTELRNQRTNSVRWNRSVKLLMLAPAGTTLVDDRVPTGFSAADTTNTIGNSENTTAASATRCRQPSWRNHRAVRVPRGVAAATAVTRTPLPESGCAGS